ncbi:MAG: M55 family metallopeptidase [Candidatus Eremiobacteraeota bacterium]|nr:M55 family metallopeptidase [Candidatus Eremiobacteraeota bacterium]
MNVYVSADMEGTAAVSSWTQCDPKNTTEYPYYRRLMSREVRAAIDGARAGGATGVLINDSHSAMRNILWDELPGDVRMIYGNRKPFSMSEGIDGTFSAAFFTGYHAGIGEADGTLDHTYSPDTVYEVRVNGIRCSETTLNAAVLGLHGVPVALVTGDRTTVESARAQLPWIEGAVVKESIGRYAVNSVSPAAACTIIREAAERAVRRVGDMQPFRFDSPVTLEIAFTGTQNADFAELIPGFQRTGGRSVRFLHDDYAVVFKAFVAAFRLGGAANAPV